MQIRPERPDDVETIRSVIVATFREASHSSQTEAAIVEGLRAADALTLSLVAVEGGAIIGHVAFSPVTIDGLSDGWHGLGPVSVHPDRQRTGIGQALIREGLDYLRRMQSLGCVVLGDPGYYGRFGFTSDSDLRYGEVPPAYFQRLAFTDILPRGEVVYHAAFNAS